MPNTYDLGASLLAYYPFNQDNFLGDVSNKLGPLTASASSPTQQATGPWGATSNSALLTFNTHQFFQVPNTLLPDPYSICIWYQYTAGATVANQFLVQFGLQITLTNDMLSTTNTLLKLSDALGEPYDIMSIPNGCNGASWKHVCIGVGNGVAKIWLNGGIVVNKDISVPRDPNAIITPNYLGRWAYSDATTFAGSIDEYRIYNKFLTNEEASAIYAFRGDTTTTSMPMTCQAGMRIPPGKTVCEVCVDLSLIHI